MREPLPALINQHRLLRLLALGVAFSLLVMMTWNAIGHSGADAHSYWSAWQDPLYNAAWHDPGDSYVYSPAFAQAIWPLTLLPWMLFLAIWATVGVLLLVACVGLIPATVLFFSVPVWTELAGGNIDIAVGLAIAVGFRWPTAWAFVLLTKVTPGIGLVYFAVRRDWRKLAIALGATAAIALVSFIVAPHLWFEWRDLLLTSPDQIPSRDVDLILSIPLLPRLIIGAGIAGWAGITNRPWAVLVAAFVGSPLPTLTRLTMLAAMVPLLGLGPLSRYVLSSPVETRFRLPPAPGERPAHAPG